MGKPDKRVWRPLDPACPQCRAIIDWRHAHPEYREYREGQAPDGPMRWDEVGLQTPAHKRLHGIHKP